MSEAIPFGEHQGVPFFRRKDGAATVVFHRVGNREISLRSVSMPADRMREMLIACLAPTGRSLLSQKGTVR